MLKLRTSALALLAALAFLATVPAASVSAQTALGNGTIDFGNPISSNTIEDAASTILSTIRAVIVVLALVFIVIGAVMYVTSAGNDKQMTMAKGAVTAAMIGLALGLAAPSFLKEIGTALGWNGAIVNDASVQTLSQIARKVLDFFLSIIGILSVIMLVVGGSTYLTSAGDEGRAETAKNIVKWAIVGIAVAFASLAIVEQVATLLV
jgi:cytochrome bd-type quinol oxidase subunit 2